MSAACRDDLASITRERDQIRLLRSPLLLPFLGPGPSADRLAARDHHEGHVPERVLGNPPLRAHRGGLVTGERTVVRGVVARLRERPPARLPGGGRKLVVGRTDGGGARRIRSGAQLTPDVLRHVVETERPRRLDGRDRLSGRRFPLALQPAVDEQQVVVVSGVYHDHPGDGTGIARGEEANQPAAERLADEDVRRLHVGSLQERAELVDDLPHGVGRRAQLAPGRAAAIVGADARESRRPRLDQHPIDREARGARFEDHRRFPRRPVARAVDVHAPAADIDEPARRGRNRAPPGLRRGPCKARHRDHNPKHPSASPVRGFCSHNWPDRRLHTSHNVHELLRHRWTAVHGPGFQAARGEGAQEVEHDDVVAVPAVEESVQQIPPWCVRHVTTP